MKILVTGATGFLGGLLAERLREEGHDVTALGRNERAGAALATSGMRFVSADLADEARIDTACAGQEFVFHVGGLTAPWGPDADFHRANVLGTRHVVDGCLRHGVRRLIHVSTPSLYFDFRHRLDISEDAPLPRKAVNAYARTKRLAELEVDRGFAAGLPTVSIRPRAFIGPGDTNILPRLIAAHRNGLLPLIDGGRALADLTVVDNVIDALLLCRDAPGDALGRKFNITNGQPLPVAEVASRLFARLGRPLRTRRVPFAAAYAAAGLMELKAHLTGGSEPQLTRYAVGLMAYSQTLDITQARQLLGYHPRIGLDEGLDRFAAWWLARAEDR